MGLLVKGRWEDQWYDTKSSNGEFIREDSQFRNWIMPCGECGPDDQLGFPAENNRYHLYVSLACPWAHRTLILRTLKKLQQIIPVTITDPIMEEQGWTFGESGSETVEPNYGFTRLYELYRKAQPEYSGRVTVPVLWDRVNETIVNNESSEIMRMLNSSFNEFTDSTVDYYPEELKIEIDRINSIVYENINNGVYRCGFATTQEAYQKAFTSLFDALEEIDRRLSKQRYLTGDRITEADWRLFTTLIRFDAVYFGHFKTNLKRIVDFRNLHPYLLDLYQQPGIAETVNMDHIKTHYYASHDMINPSRIIPAGPELDFTAPHDRDRFNRTVV